LVFTNQLHLASVKLLSALVLARPLHFTAPRQHPWMAPPDPASVAEKWIEVLVARAEQLLSEEQFEAAVECVSRAKLGAWWWTDADSEFEVRSQHVYTPSPESVYRVFQVENIRMQCAYAQGQPAAAQLFANSILDKDWRAPEPAPLSDCPSLDRQYISTASALAVQVIVELLTSLEMDNLDPLLHPTLFHRVGYCCSLSELLGRKAPAEIEVRLSLLLAPPFLFYLPLSSA
jgi:hypothetical protein